MGIASDGCAFHFMEVKSYARAYEKSLIEELMKRLPSDPPWKK